MLKIRHLRYKECSFKTLWLVLYTAALGANETSRDLQPKVNGGDPALLFYTDEVSLGILPPNVEYSV